MEQLLMFQNRKRYESLYNPLNCVGGAQSIAALSFKTVNGMNRCTTLMHFFCQYHNIKNKFQNRKRYESLYNCVSSSCQP